MTICYTENMEKLETASELRRQGMANAAIEGFEFTSEEMELFAYFDEQAFSEAKRLELLRAFCAGEFKVPRAA